MKWGLVLGIEWGLFKVIEQSFNPFIWFILVLVGVFRAITPNDIKELTQPRCEC